MSRTIKGKRFVGAKFEVFKIPNKRIGVVNESSGNYKLLFQIRTDDLKPRATHIVSRNKAVTTSLKISQDAATLLFFALKNQLEKDGILTTATAPGDVGA
jgi:hypothetical protein